MINTATVIGLGLIGGSLSLDLKARGFAKKIIGVDASESHAKKALELGLVDEVRSFEAAFGDSELVILAVPVDVIEVLLPQVFDLVGPNTAITDMGSTKRGISIHCRSHARRQQFVPSHPMAGTEYSGPNAAMLGMFDGRTAVICDQELSSAAALKVIEELYRCLGMRMIYMSSADHDLHVAYVSHLSHISSFILANTVLDIEKNERAIFDLAAGGFESTVRLAKSSPEMWAPVFEQNKEHVVSALARYIHHLQKFQQVLLDSDEEALKKMMKNANRIQRVLQNLAPNSSARGSREDQGQ